jgi:hypothetical protein
LQIPPRSRESRAPRAKNKIVVVNVVELDIIMNSHEYIFAKDFVLRKGQYQQARNEELFSNSIFERIVVGPMVGDDAIKNLLSHIQE